MFSKLMLIVLCRIFISLCLVMWLKNLLYCFLLWSIADFTLSHFLKFTFLFFDVWASRYIILTSLSLLFRLSRSNCYYYFLTNILSLIRAFFKVKNDKTNLKLNPKVTNRSINFNRTVMYLSLGSFYRSEKNSRYVPSISFYFKLKIYIYIINNVI
jgi:hypothetical protein